MKAIYIKRAKLLVVETDKFKQSPLGMKFGLTKDKRFETEEEAKKYAQRYYKNHEYSSREY